MSGEGMIPDALDVEVDDFPGDMLKGVERMLEIAVLGAFLLVFGLGVLVGMMIR